MRGPLVAAAAALALALPLLGPTAAGAAAPGGDGRLALVRGGSIWTVAPDGSDPVRLTATTGDGRPRWSPDGRRLAFTRVTGGTAHLWLMNADGSRQLQVSTLPGAGRADWSPDGSSLAFVANYDSYGPAVYHVASAAPFGTARVFLEKGNDFGTTYDSAPLYAATAGAPREVTWSRDGRALSFFNGSCYAYYQRCIDSFDPVTRFTTTAFGNAPQTTGDQELACADWSPDSRTLLMTEDSRRGPHLVMGTRPDSVRLSDAANGAFSPTGSRVAFGRVQNGVPYVWVARVDGTAQVRVAAGSIPDWQPVPSA